MQLININKTLYRKNLNIVIFSFVAIFLMLALGLGQLLILGFGEEGVSNFKYNLLGVILALLSCAAVLHSVKNKPFFTEIYYVWQLKQLHNRIFRKLKKIKAAAKNKEEKALIILLFYYQSLKLVYLLDDNTLTLSEVDKKILAIKDTIANKGLSISATDFHKEMLSNI